MRIGRELRKHQNLMIVCGRATIILGVWAALKAIIVVMSLENDQLADYIHMEPGNITRAQPSNKDTNTIYYYNIREVGGINTHATNDGRYAPKYSKNPYYDSNHTAESYLFELGYMDNLEDLYNIMNNREGYAKGIADGLQKYLENEK